MNLSLINNILNFLIIIIVFKILYDILIKYNIYEKFISENNSNTSSSFFDDGISKIKKLNYENVDFDKNKDFFLTKMKSRLNNNSFIAIVSPTYRNNIFPYGIIEKKSKDKEKSNKNNFIRREMAKFCKQRLGCNSSDYSNLPDSDVFFRAMMRAYTRGAEKEALKEMMKIPSDHFFLQYIPNYDENMLIPDNNTLKDIAPAFTSNIMDNDNHNNDFDYNNCIYTIPSSGNYLIGFDVLPTMLSKYLKPVNKIKRNQDNTILYDIYEEYYCCLKILILRKVTTSGSGTGTSGTGTSGTGTSGTGTSGTGTSNTNDDVSNTNFEIKKTLDKINFSEDINSEDIINKQTFIEKLEENLEIIVKDGTYRVFQLSEDIVKTNALIGISDYPNYLGGPGAFKKREILAVPDFSVTFNSDLEHLQPTNMSFIIPKTLLKKNDKIIWGLENRISRKPIFDKCARTHSPRYNSISRYASMLIMPYYLGNDMYFTEIENRGSVIYVKKL